MPNSSIECLVPGWFRLPATLGASIVVCDWGEQSPDLFATAGRKVAESARRQFPSFARDPRVEARLRTCALSSELDRSSVGVPVIFAGESGAGR